MGEESKGASRSGSFTPKDLADVSKHQQTRIFEERNRPQGSAPAAGAGSKVGGEDMVTAGEGEIGEAPGTDTSGVVAPPAERNRPGASTKLGGTPGALATSSGGRDTDY